MKFSKFTALMEQYRDIDEVDPHTEAFVNDHINNSFDRCYADVMHYADHVSIHRAIASHLGNNSPELNENSISSYTPVHTRDMVNNKYAPIYFHHNLINKNSYEDLDSNEKVMHYYDAKTQKYEQHNITPYDYKEIHNNENPVVTNEYADGRIKKRFSLPSSILHKANIMNHVKSLFEGKSDTISDLHNKLADNYKFPYNGYRRNALKEYTNTESSLINKNLITGAPPHKYTNEISRLINNPDQKLAEPLHVYSHTGRWDPFLPGLKVGDTIHTPAFTSTSINPTVALSRGSLALEDMSSGRHIIHFELPKGFQRGAYIGHESDFPVEREFLLDKKQNWKIKGHQIYQHPEFPNQKFHVHTVVPVED